MDAYVSVDDDAETSPELNDEQIVQVVQDPSLDGNIGNDDEENETDSEDAHDRTDERPTTLGDAYGALRTLRAYGMRACPDMEDVTDRLETLLMEQSQKCLKQSKLTDFMMNLD